MERTVRVLDGQADGERRESERQLHRSARVCVLSDGLGGAHITEANGRLPEACTQARPLGANVITRLSEDPTAAGSILIRVDMKRDAIEGPPYPITLFTYFLEVGRLLPVPATQIVSYAERTAAWEGWSPELLGRMLAARGAPTFSSDTVPGYRIAFRQTPTVIGTPLYAAEGAFEDWIEPTLTPAMRERRRGSRSAVGETCRVYESVVALTRFIPEAEHPASEELTVGWLTSTFRGLLADLNRLLDHLSFTARDWALGAVERRDLPALLPVLLQSTHADTERQIRGTAFTIPLHDDYPHLEALGPPEFDADPLQNAIDVVIEGNHGEQPFEPVFRYLRAAASERIAGDPTRAVVDLATAMELLFSQLLSTAGEALGWDAHRVLRGNDERTQLRGRVVDHLGPLLNERIELQDQSTPWGQWWSTGYALRNAAVHRGVRLDTEDARRAWDAATLLIAHVTDMLRQEPRLDPVADRLAVIGLGGEPPWLAERLPVEIDWF